MDWNTIYSIFIPSIIQLYSLSDIQTPKQVTETEQSQNSIKLHTPT